MTSAQRDALPPADLTVDAGRARDLCSQLVPEPGIDLGALSWHRRPRLVGEGWDNAVWEVATAPVALVRQRGSDRPGSDRVALVLRIPRRRSAEALLRSEAIMLRRLPPAPDTDARRLLAAAEGALLVPWIRGPLLVHRPPAVQARAAPQVARTLAQLHRPPAPGQEVPGPNPARGVPLTCRDAVVRAELASRLTEHSQERTEGSPARLTSAGASARADQRRLVAAALRIWDRGLAAPPWQGSPLVLHGDPHPANIVHTDPPTLIDLGDATTGDPASDLGALWFLDPAAAFFPVYLKERPVESTDGDDRALFDRARAWAIRYASALWTPGQLRRDSLAAAADRLLAALAAQENRSAGGL